MPNKKKTYKKIKNNKLNKNKLKNNKSTKKEKKIKKYKINKINKSKKKKFNKRYNKKKYTKKLKKTFYQNGGDAAADALAAANKKNAEWQAEREAASKKAADESASGSKDFISSARNILKYLRSDPVAAGAVKVAEKSGEAVGEEAAAVVGGDIIGTATADAILENTQNLTSPCNSQAPGFKQNLTTIACSLFESMGLSMLKHGVGGQAIGSSPLNDSTHPL